MCSPGLKISHTHNSVVTPDVHGSRAADTFPHPFILPASPVKSSKRRIHGGNRGGDHIKAPPNGFILFRSEYQAVPDNRVDADGRNKKQTEITKNAAAVWRELPKAARDEYLTRARINLAEHKREHRDYWYQRRGRDGRFVGVPELDNSVPAHGDGEPYDARVAFPPCPWTVSQPFPPLAGYPEPIGSFEVGPLVPPPRILPAAPTEEILSFPFPTSFDAVTPVNAPPQSLPFHDLPTTSSDPSLSLSSHISSSADVAMPPPAALFPHGLAPPLCGPTNHQGYLNWDRGGSSFSKQGTIPPKLPSQPATQDFSSRMLTLSRSDWEMVDLFLSAGELSGATSSTMIPHCALRNSLDDCSL